MPVYCCLSAFAAPKADNDASLNGKHNRTARCLLTSRCRCRHTMHSVFTGSNKDEHADFPPAPYREEFAIIFTQGLKA